MTDNDFILPDSKFYSMGGWYTALLLSGYEADNIPTRLLPPGKDSLALFRDCRHQQRLYGRDGLPALNNETNLYFYIIAFIYLVFGYFPLGVRIFNIMLSVVSTLFVFQITKKQFGQNAGRAFLLIGLFLPTQFVYSITLSKDFIRMFVVYFILWLIYGGGTCQRR